MTQAFLCPHCDEVIVSLGSSMKIRGKVVIVKSNNVYAVCKGCNNEVRVPLLADQTMLKSLDGRIKLYLDK